MKRNLKLNLLLLSVVIVSLSSVQVATAPGQGIPKKLETAINNGYVFVNPFFGADTIYAQQGSYFMMGWVYLVSEWENDVFSQPFDYNLYINGEEVKLYRSTTGAGIDDCFGEVFGPCKGPLYHWYAIWDANTFDQGVVLDFDIEITSSTDYAYLDFLVWVL